MRSLAVFVSNTGMKGSAISRYWGELRRRLKKFSLLLEKRNCFDPSVRGSRLSASQRVYDFEDVFGFFNAKNEK